MLLVAREREFLSDFFAATTCPKADICLIPATLDNKSLDSILIPEPKMWTICFHFRIKLT